MARTVLISGASRGIGACVAKTFAKSGDNVVINYLNSEQDAKNVAKEVERLGGVPLLVKADVSNFEQAQMLVEKTLNTFGNIDVLVCSAGIASYNLLIDESLENIVRVINTNLLGVINLCKCAIPNMISNQYGKIINISSMWGIGGASNETIYSASKGGVISFTKALAKELGLSNINVNAVAPGTILTDMVKNLDSSVLDELAGECSLGRIGNVQDVANVVEFLASDKASYITGQVISVDGGMNF